MAKRGVTITPLKGRDEVKKREGKKGVKLARRRPPPIYIDRPRYDTTTDRRMTALNGVTHYSPIRRWSSYIGPGPTTKKLQETKIHRTIFGLPGPRPTLLQSENFFSLWTFLDAAVVVPKSGQGPKTPKTALQWCQIASLERCIAYGVSRVRSEHAFKAHWVSSHAVRLRARIRHLNLNFHLRF